ncbi:MAG: hypothetical protein M3460_03450 [Actinomycetota bacterium]|nr:hypothetical protein [Actinomycetota bacterium]
MTATTVRKPTARPCWLARRVGLAGRLRLPSALVIAAAVLAAPWSQAWSQLSDIG